MRGYHREPITDLCGFQTSTALEWELEHLVPESGAAVLWNAGAKRAGAAGTKPTTKS
ncbi:MAG: hypothetical protein M3461_08780 [Pseudomonadota bacterium]|nr:hypothetical protein [Pseudomonadota bacterium]